MSLKTAKKSGFTLMELLISLLLLNLIVVPLMFCYLKAENILVKEQNLKRLTENILFANYLFRTEAANANYKGCNSGENFLSGLNGFSSDNLPSYLQDKNVKKGTDVIVFKYMGRSITKLVSSSKMNSKRLYVENNPTTPDNPWLVVANCQNGQILKSLNHEGSPLKLNHKLAQNYEKEDTLAGSYKEETYFISKSETTKSYSLYKLQNGSTNPLAHKQELLADVIDCQIFYGVSLDGKKINVFQKAEKVTDFRAVKMIKIYLTFQKGKFHQQIKIMASLPNVL